MESGKLLHSGLYQIRLKLNDHQSDMVSKVTFATLAVINLMPRAELYESYIRELVPTDTKLFMIRMKNHRYSSSDHTVLNSTHLLFNDCDLTSIDGLLVSGSALDRMARFEDATYWEELMSSLLHASSQVGSIAGVCWGALAIAKIFLGIEKRFLGKKLYGVYRSEVTVRCHSYMKNVSPTLELPHSRYAEIDPIAIGELTRQGVLIPLDRSLEAGHSCIASADSRLFMMQAHLDYPVNRLALEYLWSKDERRPTQLPENYNIYSPTDTWTETSRTIFSNWLHYSKWRKTTMNEG